MRLLAILVLLPVLAQAQEFKPFDYLKDPGNLQIQIKELAGARPAFAQRKPEGSEGGQSATIIPGQDSIDFHANGITAWFEYQYSTKSPHLTWPSFDLDKHVTSYKWFAQAQMQGSSAPYARGTAVGTYRLFTYKPPQGERWCAAGTLSHSASFNAERLTYIVCRPPGRSMTPTEAKTILDAVGTKAMPATAASAL